MKIQNLIAILVLAFTLSVSNLAAAQEEAALVAEPVVAEVVEAVEEVVVEDSTASVESVVAEEAAAAPVKPVVAEVAAAPSEPGIDDPMMAKWKEYSTPGEGHKVLDPLVGNWDYTMKFWMTGESPAEESTGTQTTQWILDGRFIEATVSGTSMGQPFNGKSITGFDNFKQEYVNVWYDNMSTGIMTSSGTFDAATQTLTEKGSFVCPMKGPMAYRWVTKIIDQDNYVFEGYSSLEGKAEFKSMEIVYKRK